ncbi:MAG: FkbM family methyltransferase [Bacteriovoracaceae bacterium]|nr:FkbM family methyltransferase [Bacteriovoracaceae bacterium]
MKNPRHLRPPLTSAQGFFSYYAKMKQNEGEKITCVQVGANDGKSNDPIYPYLQRGDWKGILLEPQVDVFENGLKQTYKDHKNVILENAALAKKSGALPFYRIAISKARWATGLSSFDKSTLERHIDIGYIEEKAKEDGIKLPENKKDLIETVMVPTLTFEDLLKKHHVQNFQLLCVDTEGYDFEIIKLLDFNKFKPEVIFFESKHLSDSDFVAAQKLLIENGYELFWEKGDTLAIRCEYPAYMALYHKIRAIIKKL